jgi:hypothetical protein
LGDAKELKLKTLACANWFGSASSFEERKMMMER